MKPSIEYKSSELIKLVEDGFKLVHKPFAKYQDDKLDLWEKCISTISDYTILEKMIFCNDILKIPPAKVFLCSALSNAEAEKLSTCDKKFIGSFFLYIFGSIFFYSSKKQISLNNPYIRTAMYFYDNSDKIKMIPDTHNKQSEIISITNNNLFDNKPQKTMKSIKVDSKN